MEQEIELKFEIDHISIKPLTIFLKTQHINEEHQLHLTNSYYDSVDNILRRNNASVRIRGTREQGKKDRYELTLKSSSGESLAGLYSRQEFNAPLLNSQLNLSVLPAAAFPVGLDVSTLSSQLITLFTTDFERKTWLIHFNQSQIEVALDQGIISSGTLSLPILEIELELKLGSKVDLLLLADKLSQFRLHLFSQSKAARGYRLVQGGNIAKIPELAITNLSSSAALSTILTYWQTNEEYALAYNNLSFYKRVLCQVMVKITPVLPLPENEYSTELNVAYCNWCKHAELITDIKTFAFSTINTQFKLYVMLLIL